MVSLVFVSHSKLLAESLVNLVRQMTGEEVKIGVAAGVGENHNEIGTDAVQIAQVIQEVDTPEGIVVLMDLGSAILSAEMALDLLPEEVRNRVHFCPAPLVEGAIAAGVQASLGSDPQTICREACQALQSKAAQLNFKEPVPLSVNVEKSAVTANEDEIHTIVLELTNAHGLHARPAARFVQTASRFKADIRVANLTTGSHTVSAKSLNSLATLGAIHGHQIRIQAQGEEAAEAIQALKKLIEDRFGETAQPSTSIEPSLQLREPQPTNTQILRGIPVSEGIAIAPIFHYESLPVFISENTVEDTSAEWQRFQVALEKVRRSILERQREMINRLGEEEAAIFEAQALLLNDEELLQNTRLLIEERHYNAARAWKNSIETIIARFQALTDDYLKQRAVDVQDVGNQVLRELSGEAHEKMIFSTPIILVANDLTPSETASLDLEHIHGIALMSGGITSHSAILARSLGIPAVTGLPRQITQLSPHTTVILDGFRREILIEPDENTRKKFESRRVSWLEEKQRLRASTHQTAITIDGLIVEVAANVGNLADAQAAVQNGADGIGLLRTEFLFLTRQTAPTEEEQFQAIHQIGMTLQGKPVIVRTLDVGGDKPLPYINQQPEANPFLGVRALRLSMQQPDLFRTQLRAILRAGADTYLRIMFPMVATIEEVIQANQFLEKIHRELEEEGVHHRWPIETGIMVEIPSAAIAADAFAEHVAFFSIGTNDLTQYTMAAERGNPQLNYLNDALHPAILRLISGVAHAAEKHRRWVGVCGELASDPEAVPILIGLGVRELSLNASGIPRIKAIVRSLTTEQAKQVAQQALTCANAQQVRSLATEFLKTISQAGS
ncbi:phosphoenolpyruvate--protein phosphotransferase [Anaerolinea sp.]|uniref:phosphoenolpyruvate--protein phosphotransferase n=1 Tax=Anaerolinea sp. TaxID=1872519 RepID=UPI002ACD2F37|nr:phosphoenolpyruvate--protein phosphotransferase [Anaerolinea sp.]